MPSRWNRLALAAAALAVLLSTLVGGAFGADNPNCQLIVPANPLSTGFVNRATDCSDHGMAKNSPFVPHVIHCTVYSPSFPTFVVFKRSFS